MINDLPEQLRNLVNKIISDAFLLCISIIIFLVVLSAIFFYLEWKGKTNEIAPYLSIEFIHEIIGK